MAFASVPVEDFVFIEGEALVARFASSDVSHRRFCTRCGTPFLMQADDQPATVDFSIATLDAPDAVVPGFHIFYASRIGWADAGDALPRHDRFRRDARGLTDGELPC